jgi:hypothetical protein
MQLSAGAQHPHPDPGRTGSEQMEPWTLMSRAPGLSQGCSVCSMPDSSYTQEKHRWPVNPKARTPWVPHLIVCYTGIHREGGYLGSIYSDNGTRVSRG